MNNQSESSTQNISWQSIIAKYNNPQFAKSIWQIVNSFVPYIALWVLMVLSMKISPWLALALSIPASGFLIRLFIIFHDCGHGSFTKSKKWNRVIGTALGAFFFTPYDRWTESHRIHHVTVGNLDKRGTGDVWTLTVQEYMALSPWKRFIYRAFRNPIIMIGIGGFLMFVIGNRFTRKGNTRKQKLNVYLTNVIIAAIAVGMSLLIGWKAYLLIQLSTMYLASIMGVYLFYLQHQYEDVVWTRENEWNYQFMALHGSSFFKLPAILRWFTGSIGYHHIHHLGPTIPNYNLARCHEENAMFMEIKPITFFKSFKSLTIRLWDEKYQKVISFREMRKLYPQMKTA
jgi:omega-6 fatty acid desaturase (delta-12 desaturase)